MAYQNSYHKDLVEAGLDEVGRGAIAGPLAVAAVILPPDFTHPDLKDSKLCSPKLRADLANLITEVAVSWVVEYANISEITDYNVSQATFLAMNRAIKRLNPQPQHLLIDGRYFKTTHSIPYTTIVKGDRLYANIAAASILAKHTRDSHMQTLARNFPIYAWHKNKGYPTPQHKDAIQKYGICEHHRTSYKLK